MMPSTLGYLHILLCTHEVSGYVTGIPMIGMPIQNVTTPTMFEAIFFKICCLFGKPENIDI